MRLLTQFLNLWDYLPNFWIYEITYPISEFMRLLSQFTNLWDYLPYFWIYEITYQISEFMGLLTQFLKLWDYLPNFWIYEITFPILNLWITYLIFKFGDYINISEEISYPISGMEDTLSFAWTEDQDEFASSDRVETWARTLVPLLLSTRVKVASPATARHIVTWERSRQPRRPILLTNNVVIPTPVNCKHQQNSGIFGIYHQKLMHY